MVWDHFEILASHFRVLGIELALACNGGSCGLYEYGLAA